MKKKYIIAIIFIFIISAIIFLTNFYSSDKQKYTQGINPPLSKLDIPFENYTFEADSGIIINTGSGSQIRIKPSSLVNSKGEQAKGQVDIKFREFHDASSIFLAGIPMSTDSNRSSFLQSAGMFELRAYANGEELNLSNGAFADIELAAYKNNKGYNLFHLNNNKVWSITDTFISKINDRKIRAIDTLKQKKKSYIDVKLITDLNRVPNLIPYKNLMWRIAINGQDEALQEAMRVNWDVIEVTSLKKQNKKYKLDFIKYLNKWEDSNLIRTYSTIAIPIYKGKNLSDRDNKELEENEANINMRINQEKQRLAKQADLLSSFKIDRMGIWNIDKIMNQDDMIWADIEFDFENEIDPILNKISIYLIFEDENSVIEYLPKDWKRVGFKRNGKMKIKAVLPSQQLVEVDDIQIKAKIGKNGKIKFSTKPK